VVVVVQPVFRLTHGHGPLQKLPYVALVKALAGLVSVVMRSSLGLGSSSNSSGALWHVSAALLVQGLVERYDELSSSSVSVRFETGV
jgi:hypothetical protein